MMASWSSELALAGDFEKAGRAVSVRAGVIGVGHMGRYHVNVLSSLDGVELAGVYDADRGRAEELSARYNCPFFKSEKELLSAVDAVCIAVPTSVHEPIAVEALRAGVHVLLEKPIAPTLAAAERIIEASLRYDRVLHIGHVERFNGAVRQVHSIVDSPFLIEVRRLSPTGGRIRDAGVVLDLMIHDLDIVLHLVNEEVRSLQASGNSFSGSKHEDVANALIRFESGCLAVLTASRVTQDKIRTLSVSQPSGYISLDYTTQEVNIHHQTDQDYRMDDGGIKYSIASTSERVFVHTVNPLQKEIAHFIACVSGVEKSIVGNDQDLRALRTALGVVDLIRSQG